MERKAAHLLPFTEARSRLQEQGFDTKLSFDRGLVKSADQNYSPKWATVLKRVNVRLKDSEKEAPLYAIYLKNGEKGFLLDREGTFQECLRGQCKSPYTRIN